MEKLKDAVPAAIIILSQSALATAKRIRDTLPHSTLYSPVGRVPQNRDEFDGFSAFIQTQYKSGRPIVALCASGIVIRSLAPVLNHKASEPPVLTVAWDGSCVVPLLGASRGANRLAEQLGRVLHCQAAVTTSGELRFGINLFCPPEDLSLINHENGKSFVAALLNGATVTFEGEQHPWLQNARLPAATGASNADLVIRIVSRADEPVTLRANELVYRRTGANSTRGVVSIIGLGPGAQQFRTFSAERALKNADDILGYDYYVDLAGPFTENQVIHKSGNGQELVRARQALALAAQGRRAALVSSGDPGIYAMAAAVLEAWEQTDDEEQSGSFDIIIEPGISAAFAAAARLGAPLGHDFALVSLSDNLKPWAIVEKRLRLASQADMALALYNPVSGARRGQLAKAIEILRHERSAATIMALAHDVGRKSEILQTTTLGQLQLEDITSRTVVLVGSSKTRQFRKNGKDWIYTPRHYPLN